MQANTNLWTELRGYTRVADFLVETIHQAGVTHVFAMPAESLNPIFDAIRKHKHIRVVTVRHEGNGAIMASAYAKLTGKLGVCLGTTGPGASHLPIGTYDAKADGVPLLAVTGQVPVHQIGSGGFQEIDTVGLLQDSVSFNRLVCSAHQMTLVPTACAYAIHHRTPVHLAFPSDVLASRCDPHPIARLRPEWLTAKPSPDESLIRQAEKKLTDKQGDCIVLVGSVGADVRETVELAAGRLKAPIAVLPEGIHYMRDVPQHPTFRFACRANDPGLELVRAARRVLIIGRITPCNDALFSPLTDIVQVVPEIELGRKACSVAIRLVGNVPEVLRNLCQHLVESSDGKLLHRAELLAATRRSESENIGRPFWSELDHVLPKNAVIAIEPGPLFESAFFNLCVNERTVTSSLCYGVRGYALPAAIAAASAYPERPAWAIASATGLAEALPELLSARKHAIPVKTICLRGLEDTASAQIDFSIFARASGYDVHEAKDTPTLNQAVREAQESKLPSIVCASAKVFSPTARPQDSRVEVIRGFDTHGLVPGPGNARDQTFGAFLLEALVRAGVTRLYGRPRETMKCFLRYLEHDDRISFIPVLHPESASIMASAHSKLTGQVGVCIAADERDLVFQLNGLYDAAFDGNPVIILTGFRLETSLLEGQAVDCERLLSNVVTSSLRLKPDQSAVSQLEQSLRHVTQSRTVIHLCFEWNALGFPGPSLPSSFAPIAAQVPILPQPDLLRDAAKRLALARRPVIMVGRGATGAREEIEKLASMLQSPIVTTMPGRGIIPDDYPHMVGAIGSSGHRTAIDAVERSDVLLVLGSSSRGAIFGLTGRSFLIQVDQDPLQFGRRGHDTLGLYGTTKETLRELLQHLSSHRVSCTDDAKESFGKPEGSPLRQRRARLLRRQRRNFERWLQTADRVRHSHRCPIAPAAICHTLRKVLDKIAQRPVVTVDVGVTTLWVYRHLVGAYDFVWTSSFATMGFALPAAIAIREVLSSRPVFAITGDGGIGITMSELATAAHLRVPITVIIFNNGKLAAIKYEQEVMGWPEYESSLFNCNFAEYARACGVRGIRVTEPIELAGAFRAALTCGEPCLIDVVCDPNAMPAPPKIHPLQAAGYLLAVSREIRIELRKLFQRFSGAANRDGFNPNTKRRPASQAKTYR
jgi:thiamine pyrophosphate-dependent acetolactate synthase large subunit-like protein